MNKKQSESFKLYVIEPAGTSRSPDGSGAPGEELDLQSGGLVSLFSRQKEVPSEKILSSWHNTNRALVIMIEDAKKMNKGIRLEELEVNLSVSAEGNVGFVAAKAEAGIVLKFRRA
jgi:hypothetical protein